MNIRRYGSYNNLALFTPESVQVEYYSTLALLESAQGKKYNTQLYNLLSSQESALLSAQLRPARGALYFLASPQTAHDACYQKSALPHSNHTPMHEIRRSRKNYVYCELKPLI